MDLSLEILGDPVWSYAYAGTRRSVLKQITLNQAGALPARDVEVFPRVRFDFPLPEAPATVWEGARRTIEARGQRIGQPISWDRIPIEMNYVLLSRLLERVEGRVFVEIVDAATDEVLATDTRRLALLAPNQWQFELNFQEVLAAFVLPSDPYVHEILRVARELLDQRTGDSSTEGYQSEASPDFDDRPLRERSRAFHIANAIYDAMSSMGYAYSNPPGMFDGGAQRVRTPSQVKAEHCATCLDSSVLLAACLAQAGLEPVLFLVRGHAFAGYLTGAPLVDGAGQLIRVGGKPIFGEDAVERWVERLGSALRPEANLDVLQYLLSGGHIQPVETTTTTSGLHKPFVEACGRRVEFSSAAPQALNATVLVGNAWRAGLTPPVSLADVPLPGVMVRPANGSVPSVSGKADTPVSTLEDEALEDLLISPEEREIPPRVRQWLASLLDLSTRNPLLKLKKSSVVDFELPADFLGDLDDLLYTPKKKIEIVSPAALPFEWVLEGATADEFRTWVKSKKKLVHPAYSGVNGIQRWVEAYVSGVRGGADKPVRGLPAGDERGVRAIQADRTHPAHSMSDAELVQRLRDGRLESLSGQLKASLSKVQTKAKEDMLATGTNNLYLAIGAVTWTETSDFRGKGKTTEWNAPLYLYPVILEGGKGSPYTIRLDPNGDATPNYCLHEKLKRPPYNLDLRELVNPTTDDKGLDINKLIAAVQRRLRQAKLDNFAVLPTAVLGVFNYSTFGLWRDFKDSWKLMSDISPAAKHLMYTPNVHFTGDPPVPEPRLEPYMPIAADDSQREAVQWALDGRSFRLEGPPGTGKSQTITNLLASCIANNKKVLFVAEKQTALNAVKERLDDAGLGHYCLNLHAKGDSDTRLRKKITEALETAIAQRIDPEDAAWNALQLRLRKEQEALDRYRASLHEAPEGLPAWVANEERLSLGEGPTVDLPASFVESFEDRWRVFEEVVVLLDEFVELVGNPTTHPWRLIAGCRPEEGSYARLGRALQSVLSTYGAFDAKGPAWARLIDALTPAGVGGVSKAIELAADHRLPDLALVERVSDAAERSITGAGADMLLEQVTRECSALAARVAPFVAAVSPDFLRSPLRDGVEHAMGQLSAAMSSAEFRAVYDEWTSLSVEVSSRLTSSLADQLLSRPNLTVLEDALAEFQSPAQQEAIDALANEVRALEALVRVHAPNVGPQLLGRPDLVNVQLLAQDAESAGVLSRKKKFKALRDLLGADAVAADDRMLIFSLKELLPLAARAATIRDQALRNFPEAQSIEIRPWVPSDVDVLARAVHETKVRRLANAAALEVGAADGQALVEVLRAAVQLSPSVRRALELLRTNLPVEAAVDYRPWDPEERLRLSTALTARYAAAVRTALGPYANSEDPSKVATAVGGWLDAAAEIDRLRQQVAESLCPNAPEGFAPWVVDDILRLQALRGELLQIGSVLADPALRGALAGILQAGVTRDDTALVADFAAGWAALHQCVEITPETWAAWLGSRSTLRAVLDDFPGLVRDGGDNHRFLDLTRWLGLLGAVGKLGDVGLECLRPLVMSGEVSVDEFVDSVRRSAIKAALRMRLEQGNLDRFDRKVHERRIRSFEGALTQSRTLLTRRIPGLVSKRREARALPTGNDVGATQALLKGLQPKRGERVPIRDLIARYGEALAGEMTCFLMSPDSVATLVPVGSIKFDLVVFDEASQVLTSHAVGALGRGKACIVVGDSRQMPPSTGFASNSGAFVDNDEVDDEEEGDQPRVDDSDLAEDGSVESLLRPDAAPDAESILSEFKDCDFPHLQLLCHYRSKDELLIAFSNTHIYDKPMLTFPSIKGMQSTALRFVHVADGFYQRDKSAPPIVFANSPALVPALRTNVREAEEVAAETMRRLTDPARRRRRAADPDGKAESIIIVTFNVPQMRLIEAMLRDLDPDLFDEATAEGEPDENTGKRRAPQLKIRNLESVQGDEAEVVIFSVAFSRTPKGTFPLNWGPVTASGGERRLNVAVTRAQHEMIVFASFLPEEMATGGKVLTEQAAMVQRFLALALHGPHRSVDVGVSVTRSRHIEEVAQALRERGYEVHTQLGLSTLRVDVAVRRPDTDHWQVAIMVDDVCWSERGSAFQREVLPRQVLPALGWSNVVRVWMPSWLNEREEILTEIDAAIAGVGLERDDEDLTSEQSDETESILGGSIPEEQQPLPDAPQRRYAAFEPYEVVPRGSIADLDNVGFNQPSRKLLEEIINGILLQEAPIEEERLAKFVCNTLGLKSVNANRVAQVLKLLPRDTVKKDVVGRFAWTKAQPPETWSMYRTSIGALVRDCRKISAYEYCNALVDIVERSHRVSQEAAVREVAATFGFRNVTENVREVIEAVLKWAVRQGRVRLADGEYLPAWEG